MEKRVELQAYLETICDNVYFQPPTNTSIRYPAIVYSRRGIGKIKANNKTYKKNRSFDITVIDYNPDSKIAAKLLELDYCEFDRQFINQGLNHINLILYYN